MATKNILWCIQNCAAYVAHDDAMDELNSLTRKLEIGQAQFTEMKSEISRLHQALTEANELYNAVEAMNLELNEHITQDELAFVQMIHANTRLTEDVKRLTAELAQCKHALDDEGEMCECGHPMSEHSHKHGAGCLVLMNDWVYCKCEVTK